jgi:preprotein translocase subunit SecG
VLEDTSVDAFTPTIGYAAIVVSVTVFIFFVFIATVFWLTGLTNKEPWKPKEKKNESVEAAG